jgi:predicted Zn-dependent protease
MARAGYDPNAAIELWRRLSKLEQETKDEKDFLSNFPLMRTHPCGEERLANLQTHVGEALKVFQQHRPIKASV